MTENANAPAKSAATIVRSPPCTYTDSMRYQFYTCDVFTETRFGGNPLAVFPHASGLTDRQMQQIAREFNYSETAFVLEPSKGGTRSVRIFTPTTEVQFAGHPNIGTAFVLAEATGEISSATSSVVFEEAAGLVPIRIERRSNGIVWCELETPQVVSIGASISASQAAAALTLEDADIVTTTHPPQEASVGYPFLFVQVQDMGALQRARANTEVLRTLETVVPDVHVYVRTNDAYDIRARMFAPMDNVPEDPATGSANCALVGMLRRIEGDDRTWRIAQGIEMGRPSLLEARTEGDRVWIGGSSVLVTEGTIEVD